MKNLKFIFVFLVFAGLASCSNDDDANVPAEIDRIVGTWNIQSIEIDGEEWELSDCELQSRMNFLANGNLTVTGRSEDFETEECVSEVSSLKWENRGNNVYRITEGEEFDDVTIVFSNNNNTITISQEDEDVTYSETYIRV